MSKFDLLSDPNFAAFPAFCFAVGFTLYRKDLFYGEAGLVRFSTEKLHDKMVKHSEYFQKFEGYKIDEKLAMKPTTAPTLNLNLI